jgi:glycine dehydrogenase
MAGMYAVYHGPQGLKTIAGRIHRLTCILDAGLRQRGVTVLTRRFFDTIRIDLAGRAGAVYEAALASGYNLRRVSDTVLGIALNEKTTREDIARLVELICGSTANIEELDMQVAGNSPISALLREDRILIHPVFNTHHSEHKMLRYLRKLQGRDLALDHAMIALGSCTMKLNATSEMIPVTWPEFSDIHPFAPAEQVQGYLQMISQLEDWLKAITGFDAISMQPNSGAQGEYAGLAAVRRFQAALGEGQRNVCLIPKSAHGTNPASAQMCGLEVVAVECDDHGNVDLADLEAKAAGHAAQLCCLMVTYPSTHGVFEEGIKQACAIVHRHGGQVYMDGANLNALVGLASPAAIGADVSHMNLHKTFCIPHGGGGPGMGPIGVQAHLAPYLPGHVAKGGEGAVSAAPYGSAGILPISWMYIAMMGGAGLKRASEIAILNANYIAELLKAHYPVLYVGKNGRVAHECILDIRPIKAASGISETDIAKRLMDYGFHAPTVSFPVAGTIMIEPTESESKTELDRFVAALLSIREEIRQVEAGQWPAEDNPLKRAPHTQADLAEAEWNRPYSRQQAVFPLPWVAENKFWPSVNRIDDVYGDRNLFCACVPMENYSD